MDSELFRIANVIPHSPLAISQIIGWDNSPHHPDLPNAPHHFHAEERGVCSSSIGSNPEKNILIVAKEINRFLKKHV